MDFQVHVDKWDLSSYPERDPRDKKPGSDSYKLTILAKNGEQQWKYTPRRRQDRETGEVKEVMEKHQPKMFFVTGVGKVATKYRNVTAVSKIAPEDLRNAELEMGGKPSLVQMAMWAYPVFASDGRIMRWTKVDRVKDGKPVAWRQIALEVYDGWRKAAYDENFPDPFEGEPYPTTRMDELEKENRSAQSILDENAALKKKLAELEKKVK